MQARYKAMMEQKVYMNEQLKAIMKRNRVLEVNFFSQHTLSEISSVLTTFPFFNAG